MTELKIQDSYVDFEAFKKTFESFGETKVAWLAGLLQGESYFSIDEHRVTAKPIDPNYKPVPGTPTIKLEMIEPDLMAHIGEIFSKTVITENRITTAGNPIYKVTVSARNEVEYVLKRILPYIVGDKTRSTVQKLLNTCNEYNQWLSEGGKTKAAQLANKKSQEARKARKALEDKNQ